MTDASLPAQSAGPVAAPMTRVAAGLRRRHAEEQRFRIYGIVAIGIAAAMLVWLLFTIISQGYTAFFQTRILLEVEVSEELAAAENYRDMFFNAVAREFPDVDFNREFPETRSIENEDERRAVRAEKRAHERLMLDIRTIYSTESEDFLRQFVRANPQVIGQTLTLPLYASSRIDMVRKDAYAPRAVVESPEFDFGLVPFSATQIAYLKELEDEGKVSATFNWNFLTSGPSNRAEIAGLGGAIIGSALTLAVTLLLAFPVGVAAAIYLEEFAPKNKITDVIEVNINNLAAVPSIIFGLLGLAMFLNFFGLPRHTPLVGGMVIALMTLPTIIIASRAALKAVPPSIRQAALGMGASRMQTVTHHVLPLALPGILTGTIIGMAQALGETAPLLLIGMKAYIGDIPATPLDSATVIPVQIYQWASLSDRAFVEKTSAAIMVLLAFLVAMNLFAVILRKRFERRW